MIVRDDKDPANLEPTDRVFKFNDNVKFDFKYPTDYKKTKHMKDGIVELHRLQAEDFAARGFGKIVK
jgi:hypothetical protein